MSNNYTNEQNQHTDGGDPTRLVPPESTGECVPRPESQRYALRHPGASPSAAVSSAIHSGSRGTIRFGRRQRGCDQHRRVPPLCPLWRLPSGADDVGNPLTYRLRNRTMPLSPEATTEVHGCTRINSDGTAEMADGRLVGMARIHGRDTDLQSPKTPAR